MDPATRQEALDPTDPYAREQQTFPRLSPEQIERARLYGREEAVPAGTVLFSRGQRSVDFFIVLDGSIEIYDRTEDGNDRVFTVHREHQFTGELDLFNDRAILVSGRAGVASRLLRVERARFPRLVATETDIGETVMRAFILRRVGFIRHEQGGVVLVGSQRSADMLRLQSFLSRNGYPVRALDVDTDPDALAGLAVADTELPAVIGPDGTITSNPTTAALADNLGLAEPIGERVRDVVVVGAGPAGLAAAVYAASEGLDTLVLESEAPGGQAGTSSKIENYLGFPTGISGQALAGRAQVQAQKFGATLAIARCVARLSCEDRLFRLELDDGLAVRARAIVVATGARYRTLDIPGYERFEGRGIHYAATWLEGSLCAGKEIVVVGGGNSAGQAAVFMSRIAGHVHVLVRGTGLAASMSDYLVQRILASPRITLRTTTAITALEGDAHLEHVTWRDARDGSVERRPIEHVFVMIGATPNTEWLAGSLALDAAGFVPTGGRDARSPFETALPGVFAVGDVRAGSVKRVASAVGEGAVVVQAIHHHLAQNV